MFYAVVKNIAFLHPVYGWQNERADVVDDAPKATNAYSI